MKRTRCFLNLFLIAAVAFCQLALSACSHSQGLNSLPQSAESTSKSQSPPLSQTSETMAVVKSVKANLRDKPARSGQVISELEKDDRVTVLTPTPVGPWYRVPESRRGAEGWIHGNLIAVEGTSPVARPTAFQPNVTPARRSDVPSTSGRSYINVDGDRIPSPVFSDKQPAGATAQCRDGSYSFSQHRQGTCSHHGGVSRWL
jgi:hypothetical protein